jgi:ABC-type multidrug transport system ATPase subunit
MRSVSRSFGTTVALRGVDASFASGERIIVEGRNGSGKSTLIGILGTAIRPSGGEVSFEPQARSDGAAGGLDDIRSIRRQIGWVSHETHAYPDLTARQNVQLAAGLYRVDSQRAWGRVAARFGLDAFADRPLRQQSRGQRQRVALARAFVHAPSVLLLDEPTAGLDVEGVQRLLEVVLDEAAKGAIVVLVTHDAMVANAVATRRIKLEAGRLVA